MKTTALLVALLCASSAGFAQQAKPAAKAAAAKAAPKSVDRFAIPADEKVSWHDVRETDLEGRAFPTRSVRATSTACPPKPTARSRLRSGA